jgi:hypothetical protein
LSVCNTTEEEEKRNNLKVCNFCFDPVAFQSAYEISLRSTAIPRKCLENLVDKCRLCFTEGSKANPVLRVENAFLERELTGIEVWFNDLLSPQNQIHSPFTVSIVGKALQSCLSQMSSYDCPV